MFHAPPIHTPTLSAGREDAQSPAVDIMRTARLSSLDFQIACDFKPNPLVIEIAVIRIIRIILISVAISTLLSTDFERSEAIFVAISLNRCDFKLLRRFEIAIGESELSSNNLTLLEFLVLPTKIAKMLKSRCPLVPQYPALGN